MGHVLREGASHSRKSQLVVALIIAGTAACGSNESTSGQIRAAFERHRGHFEELRLGASAQADSQGKTAYMAAAVKDLAEVAAEAMLDAQIQMEATLRRFEITGILDYNEAYRALGALPAQEAEAKVAAWWARNPGPDDPSMVAPSGSL